MLAGSPGMFGGDRQQRRQQRAETARRYAEWLGESESVASWQSQAQITSERLLDDGNTLVLRRWPRRQVVAEQGLAAQQRLAFAKGALSERLGSDTSPLWEFGFDNCHEIFEVHAPLIRQVFLGFQWDIAVVADPTIRLEVTRRRTEEPDDDAVWWLRQEVATLYSALIPTLELNGVSVRDDEGVVTDGVLALTEDGLGGRP